MVHSINNTPLGYHTSPQKATPLAKKEASPRAIFGDALARQIRNGASVCHRWTEEQRQEEVPFWVHSGRLGRVASRREHAFHSPSQDNPRLHCPLAVVYALTEPE